MTTFSPSILAERLRALLPPQSHRLCVAFSGGLDSTVLLAALAELRPAFSVRAIHIDHQLQPDARAWAERCARVAERYAIALTSLQVNVNSEEGGIEEAARCARYEALHAQLEDAEALLTAHHADDQLETMLLALVRGAGVRGMSAMPSVRPFGRGVLVRPLLGFSRAQLEEWARARGLEWITDPTNDSQVMDRNYLRHSVVPGLLERWPAAMFVATRSAEQISECSELLDELAALDAPRLGVGRDGLDVARLAQLSDARRRNVLRYWLRAQGVRAPTTRKLNGLAHDVLRAAADRTPCIVIDGHEVRRHREVLYCMPKLGEPPDQSVRWSLDSTCSLPRGLGALTLQRAEPDAVGALSCARLPETLEVRFRAGGEQIKVAQNRPRRALKKFLQEADVLPWWRGRLPLLYAQERLIAVGDLWVAPDLVAVAGERAATIRWRDKPSILAVR